MCKGLSQFIFIDIETFHRKHQNVNLSASLEVEVKLSHTQLAAELWFHTGHEQRSLGWRFCACLTHQSVPDHLPFAHCSSSYEQVQPGTQNKRKIIKGKCNISQQTITFFLPLSNISGFIHFDNFMGNPFFIYTFISQYDVLDGWSWMISLFRVYLPPALSDYKLFIKGVYLKWKKWSPFRLLSLSSFQRKWKLIRHAVWSVGVAQQC